MTFNFNAKNVFLTYPNCPLSKEEVLAKLSDRMSIAHYTIAQENHENGEPHIHAVLTFSSRKHTVDPRYFDLEGYHPNVQCPRKLLDAVRYCKKGENYISTHSEKRGYGELIAEAEDADNFLSLVEANFPRDAVLAHERIRAFAEYKFKKKNNVYVPAYTEFANLPGICKTWYDQEFLGRLERPKTLCVIGPSRCGKTEWARSLGRHIYWNGMVDLATFDDEAKYIIFDDFDWEYFPNKKSWWGAQKEFTITDQYRKKKTIKWGKPMIWLGNEDLDLNKWFRDNSYVVNIHSPLYSYDI